MINKLKSKFPHIEEENCLEIVNNKYFEILDHEIDKRCYIVSENGQFKVSNSCQKELNFVAIDNCLFDSSDVQRSDCMVFDNKIICFIELKNCKNKNISKNRKKAKSQLISTIEFFRDNFDLEFELEAYICVTCFREDEGFIMTPRASNSDAQLEFEETLNTKLFYKCNKSF